MVPTSENAFVSLGSNLGDRAGNLILAVRGIMDSGMHVARLSSIYETEPVETFPQPNFLNMVAELTADGLPEPEQLLARLLRVEYSLGRTREAPNGPRTIDLDLLFYGDKVRTTEFLTLPHPRLARRRFVLEPMSELAPKLVHPTLQKTIEELLSEIGDDSQVRLWKPATNLA
ncbi:MAG TPA: 2-amino-4-hydroxy-6-hydroxymethyldihydropteridine diphosphokinase [Pyrinomonadaceae bacterium]|nr:2-amino-4-hydroxy-6-hydroxymethyldihydropteridine diphosphokinase [Pyrinomonadaceae bacterium]